jgi:hypothetical protein
VNAARSYGIRYNRLSKKSKAGGFPGRGGGQLLDYHQQNLQKKAKYRKSVYLVSGDST